MPTTRLGLDAKLYRNTGTYEAPVWNEVTAVRDLTLDMTKGEADVSTRGNGGWAAKRGALKEGSIDFQLILQKTAASAADIAAFKSSFFDNESVELAVLDGEIETADVEGLRATFEVMSFKRNEQLTEAITYDVTIKITDADNAPEWMVVT